MFKNNVESMNMARALALHAAARQEVVARNVANADTPGYIARDLPAFGEIHRAGAEIPLRTTRPSHHANDPLQKWSVTSLLGEASPNGNSVSVESEMVRAADVRQQHDMALAVYKSLSGIVRTSLDRGR